MKKIIYGHSNFFAGSFIFTSVNYYPKWHKSCDFKVRKYRANWEEFWALLPGLNRTG